MRLALATLLLSGSTGIGWAQKHELGLTLGRLSPQDRDFSGGKVTSGGGTALQANYGIRLAGGGTAAVYFQTHFLASPQRLVASSLTSATRDYASLYATPGLRVKFAPQAALSPWVEAGGGYGLYEHSTTRLDGQPNGAPRHESGGVVTFGGGADVRVTRWLALRGEVRDFLSRSPDYNVTGLTQRQHNVVAGGGFVLRFGE